MFAQCFGLIVLSTFALALANDDPSANIFRGHVSKNDSRYEVVTAPAAIYEEPLNVDNLLATGFWDQSYNSTGWSVLEIKTLDNQTNVEQAYAAGLLEGQFTRG